MKQSGMESAVIIEKNSKKVIKTILPIPNERILSPFKSSLMIRSFWQILNHVGFHNTHHSSSNNNVDTHVIRDTRGTHEIQDDHKIEILQSQIGND